MALLAGQGRNTFYTCEQACITAYASVAANMFWLWSLCVRHDGGAREDAQQGPIRMQRPRLATAGPLQPLQQPPQQPYWAARTD